MATTNTKNIDVSLDHIYDTNSLQTSFNKSGTFNEVFNLFIGYNFVR